MLDWVDSDGDIWKLVFRRRLALTRSSEVKGPEVARHCKEMSKDFSSARWHDKKWPCSR
jgi:hypothetical protein